MPGRPTAGRADDHRPVPGTDLAGLRTGAGGVGRARHGHRDTVVACFCLAHARLAPTRPPGRTLALALLCAAGAGLVGAGLDEVWLSAALTSAMIVAGLLTWPTTGSRLPPGAGRYRCGWPCPV